MPEGNASMKFAPNAAPKLSGALVPVLLALAACGGGAEEADSPAAGETPAAVDATASAATETPAAGETPAPTATPSESPSPTPTATTAAAAEPASFAQCKVCHAVEPGKNGIGPTLASIWGDRAGVVPGFEFSQQMKDSGLVWNQANLDRYLTDPRGVVPGTKMAFGGVKDAAQRQTIINYLKTL